MRNRRAHVAVVMLLVSLAACSSGATPGWLPVSGSTAGTQPDRGYLERLLYSFRSGTDGGTPAGTLVEDASGALYGTTAFGGGGPCFGGCGTVFKLTPAGSGYAETVIYRFQGSSSGDGSGPQSGVVADTGGNIYGTTEYGGDASGDGTVFELTPSKSGYSERVLYAFQGGTDGWAPIGGVTRANNGDLFGTTLLGGGQGCDSNGCGTVFVLQRSSSNYTEKVMHRFTGGRDGATPGSPPLLDSDNVLYGVTATGGGDQSCGSAPINRGCGTIYSLTTSKRPTFHTLYAFLGAPSDSANAFAGLTLAHNGTLYGMGQYGGSANSGAAFAFVRTGAVERLIHSFNGGNDGSYPLYALTAERKGRLFGTTGYGGGQRNAGIAFELVARAGGAFGERILRRFNTNARGLYPNSGLLAGSNGQLYGVTMIGGSASDAAGTVFALQR
jgi:uncharacterized repeat protein (TIGR03803 family)